MVGRDFEWDGAKRLLNIEKHGIDFLDAVEIFQDDHLAMPLSFAGEERHMALGRLRGRPVVVVFTYRGTRRRLISARRAAKNEEKEINARLPPIKN